MPIGGWWDTSARLNPEEAKWVDWETKKPARSFNEVMRFDEERESEIDLRREAVLGALTDMADIALLMVRALNTPEEDGNLTTHLLIRAEQDLALALRNLRGEDAS